MRRLFSPFVLIFGLCGLGLVGLPITLLVRSLDHWRHWPHVQAKIIDYDQSASGEAWRPVYGYTLQERPIRATPFWSSDDPGPDVGTELTLAINPADPTDFETAPGITALYVIPILIGAVFLLFALVFLFPSGPPETGEGTPPTDEGRVVAVPLLLKPFSWLLMALLWLFSLQPPFGRVTGLALFFSLIAAGAGVHTRFEVAGNPLDPERLFGSGWVDPREPRDWHWAGALLLLAIGLRIWTTWQKHRAAAKGGTLGLGR